MFFVHDSTNHPHTLLIEEEMLLLDGVPSAIVALEDNQVTLGGSTGKVSFSYATLGQALLGDRPTPAAVGQLLVQYLGRWSALQALVASLKHLQACLGQIMTEAQPWLVLPLPEQHFDDLTRRALDAYDGTEETTRMLARILGQSPEVVIAWARRIGNTVELPAPLEEPSTEQQPDHVVAHRRSGGNKTAQAVVEKSTRPRFRWTAEQVKQLEEDFLTSDIPGVVACMHAIEARHGWPYNSIQSKVYELELPQKKRAAATGRETSASSQEDHSSEQEQASETSVE